MSEAWAGGSTRAWRKVRLFVLERDGYRCQVRTERCTAHDRTLPVEDRGRADCAHHTLGRKITGDDPRYIVAACTPCNLTIGEPAGDPRPKMMTKW